LKRAGIEQWKAMGPHAHSAPGGADTALLLLRQQIGVAREQPTPFLFFAQDDQMICLA
jgi:hypothetical protein